MATILIVEDNPDNMDLVQEILEDADFNIVSATRAEDGIKALESNQIDLILMDVSLPDMDGLTATGILKADERYQSIPIIGLSAHAMESDRQSALDAGCDAYETKPIDEPSLLATIHNFIN